MNFDRVADIYDETRGIPDEVVERVAERIAAATGAGPKSAFLEIGIGTGRIALPLIEAGYPYTGVDISEKMLGRLREKAGPRANLRLEQADIAKLPFPDDSFDVAISVHVLHLIPEWRDVLTEIGRVLKPGGYFVLGNDNSPPQSEVGEIRRQWRTLVRELGGELRPRYGEWEDVLGVLSERDWQISVYRVARWEPEPFSALEYIETLSRRTFSDSWNVADDVLGAAHDRLLEWARERFGDINRPLDRKLEFLLAVARAPAQIYD